MPEATNPAARARTSSANCLEVTSCQPPPERLAKTTESGKSRSLVQIMSVRLPVAGSATVTGLVYSFMPRTLCGAGHTRQTVRRPAGHRTLKITTHETVVRSARNVPDRGARHGDGV